AGAAVVVAGVVPGDGDVARRLVHGEGRVELAAAVADRVVVDAQPRTPGGPVVVRVPQIDVGVGAGEGRTIRVSQIDPADIPAVAAGVPGQVGFRIDGTVGRGGEGQKAPDVGGGDGHGWADPPRAQAVGVEVHVKGRRPRPGRGTLVGDQHLSARADSDA